ncbi:MAG: alpha/beta fold hydrolase [Reyranella sp.]|nr:alpha/beta fold hydrolase [Reyranella sp.]
MSALPLPIAALAAASHIAPTLVAPFFRRLMLHPRKNVRAPPVLDLPTADARLNLGEGLVAWRWGEGPTVLLAHGFEGSPAQFGAVIDALTGHGFAAVALDMPAHGASGGDEASPATFAHAVGLALGRLGPVHAVVGHSLGAAASLYAVAQRGGVGRIALVSAPSALERVLRGFAGTVRLSRRATDAFLASVERHVGQPAADFDVRRVAPLLSLPILLIHDQNDRQVPVVEAARAAHVLPGAELMVTRGLGHNRLLADPAVVAAIAEFVAAQETTGRA